MKQTQSFIAPEYYDTDQIFSIVKETIFPELEGKKKILLIPPDITRLYSRAGQIAGYIYDNYKNKATVHVIPALGSHLRMTDEEHRVLFGTEIPSENILHHNWRKDTVDLGKVPAAYIREISEGKMDEDIDISINHLLVDGGYDYILSLGQVVPHEVVGLANYSKNIFVGLGGASMVDATHFLSGVYGVERILGRADTPVRMVFDYAEKVMREHGVLVNYLLTVVARFEDKNQVKGIFFGTERDAFEQASVLSQEYNITYVDKPLNKVVVYMQPDEFRSTWVSNKAIYRTRMAIADNGKLLILAPGIRTLGEDETMNQVLNHHGYNTSEEILKIMETPEGQDLRENRGVACHMILSASDNRFQITYALKELDDQTIKNAKFNWVKYDDVSQKYDPAKLKNGYNIVDGEEIYYIDNPALGLWADKARFI